MRHEKTRSFFFGVFDQVRHKPDCTATGNGEGLKFLILEVEGLHHLCREKKGADQVCGDRAADLRLCFRICKSRFSLDAAHVILIAMTTFEVISFE